MMGGGAWAIGGVGRGLLVTESTQTSDTNAQEAKINTLRMLYVAELAIISWQLLSIACGYSLYLLISKG